MRMNRLVWTGIALGTVITSGIALKISMASTDRVIRESEVYLQGQPYYRTANGNVYPPADAKPTNPAGGDPTGVYSTYTPTGANTPETVSLPVTPVQDQGANGGCWAFADIAAVEAEYLHQYGMSLGLSEQYFIFNMHQYWGNVPNVAGDFTLISQYGLPPRTAYPYNPGGPWNALPPLVGLMIPTQQSGGSILPYSLATMGQAFNVQNLLNPSVTPGSFSSTYTVYNPAPGTSFQLSYSGLNSSQIRNLLEGAGPYVVNQYNVLQAVAYVNTNQLAADVANYNPYSMAPIGATEQARYAPTHAQWVNQLPNPPPGPGLTHCSDPNAVNDHTTDCGSSLSPYFEVLKAGHVILIDTDASMWASSGTGSVINYNPNGHHDAGHVVILTGYNKSNQTFTFKNSWGAGWNGNGMGLMSFYMVKMINPYASIITALRPPSAGVLGTAIWDGFWYADLGNGTKGVAVIRHNYPGEQVRLGNTGSDVGDQFYAFGTNTPTSLGTVLSGVTATDIAFGGGPLGTITLHRTLGTTTAIFHGPYGSTSWSRYNPALTAPYSFAPQSYSDIANDPYLLPPYNFSWQQPYGYCNQAGDAYLPTAVVNFYDGNGQVNVPQGVCMTASGAVPSCGTGTLVIDGNGGFIPGADSCSDGSNPTCTGTIAVSGPGLPQVNEVPTNIGQVFDVNGTFAFQPPWYAQTRMFLYGQDACLSAIYTSPGPTCPAGASPNINGDGCWTHP